MPHRSHLRSLAFATVALLLAAGPASARAAGAETETVYLDRHTAQINTGAAVVFDASPGLLSSASPIFIIGFPVAPDITGPITLPSGYVPQHNGFPPSPIAALPARMSYCATAPSFAAPLLSGSLPTNTLSLAPVTGGAAPPP